MDMRQSSDSMQDDAEDMNCGDVDEVTFSPSEVKVMRALRYVHTVNDIARACGISRQRAQKILLSLVERGCVYRVRRGRSYVYYRSS
jgi:predicted transcriptional regulator